MKFDYPDTWDIVKDWREELPPSPVRLQSYTSQCWNLSITECVKDIAFLEKNPLRNEISSSEMRDWLPFLSSCFDMNTNPPAHSVNPRVWPAYDVGNGYGATSVEVIFRFLKVYGTLFMGDYPYEQPLLGNNFTMFSMKKFHEIRTSASERVSIDTFRILDSKSAIPIIKKEHTAVGCLYTKYEEFEEYDYHKRLSPIEKPHGPDHMVYIVGYGFDNGIEEEFDNDIEESIEEKTEEKTEGTECYLVKNSWKDWGYEGFGMVPVKLFKSVSYPKGVHVRDSSIVVNDDFHLADARKKYYELS